MGIDQVSGMTGAVSYQTQVTKPVQSVNTESRSNENVAETSQTAVSNQPAVIGQATESNSGYDKNQNGAKKQDSEPKEATIKDVKEINKLINHNTIAEFGYNEPTNRITIKIKDKETDEVIKEIPSEKALEMLAKAWELAGILVDEKR